MRPAITFGIYLKNTAGIPIEILALSLSVPLAENSPRGSRRSSYRDSFKVCSRYCQKMYMAFTLRISLRISTWILIYDAMDTMFIQKYFLEMSTEIPLETPQLFFLWIFTDVYPSLGIQVFFFKNSSTNSSKNSFSISINLQ